MLAVKHTEPQQQSYQFDHALAELPSISKKPRHSAELPSFSCELEDSITDDLDQLDWEALEAAAAGNDQPPVAAPRSPGWLSADIPQG